MTNEYVLATNDDGDLAVRTVSATEASGITDTLSVITRTEDGKLAVRTVGGGGDAHNKGYFATLAELQAAYPTGEAGDWAIVAESDTVYIWDDTQQAWVDTDQKGQVTSVNNQTGAVVLGAQDVGAVPQYSSMPTASEDELGNIYQFTGTTDANYTNGYFYKCVSDGQNPATYSWSQVSVQPAPSGLPDQTGQSGKFLTTDGTDASWATINALQNTATATNSLTILGTANTTRNNSINIGSGSSCGQTRAVCIGYNAQTGSSAVAIGSESRAVAQSSVSIGYQTAATAFYSIQIGGGDGGYSNTVRDTVKFGNSNGNYEIMSADGTIPADRLTHAINKYSTMPTAGASNLGWIVQYTGVTDATYTHGYIYECVSDGGNPATYSWSAVEVQASSGGLPTQTGNAGKFLTTDGTDVSWSDKPLVNTATFQQYSLGVGFGSSVLYSNAVAAGAHSSASQGGVSVGASSSCGVNGISIGNGVYSGTNAVSIKGSAGGVAAIQIGQGTNNDNNTVKFGNNNGNFEIMSADGTIPAARHASLPAADGTYVLKLVIASGVPTLSWVAE